MINFLVVFYISYLVGNIIASNMGRAPADKTKRDRL